MKWIFPVVETEYEYTVLCIYLTGTKQKLTLLENVDYTYAFQMHFKSPPCKCSSIHLKTVKLPKRPVNDNMFALYFWL